MARYFSPAKGGVRVGLDADERALVARLLGEVDQLLDDGAPAPSDDPMAWLAGIEASIRDGGEPTAPEAGTVPSDPAVARLLPEGSRDDPAASAEFRRLTEADLRGRKRDALGLAASALERHEPVILAPPEAMALLKGLTDIRLVLAERLGLKSDADAELMQLALEQADPAEEDPWVSAAALYDVLTWWQEGLVSALGR